MEPGQPVRLWWNLVPGLFDPDPAPACIKKGRRFRAVPAGSSCESRYFFAAANRAATSGQLTTFQNAAM